MDIVPEFVVNMSEILRCGDNVNVVVPVHGYLINKCLR
jgi:hypothetical protein